MLRADYLYQQYLKLGTLQKVGDAQSPPITRERVRQILTKAGHTQRNSRKIYTDEELKERQKIWSKKYYQGNKEKVAQAGKKWRTKNAAKIKEINRLKYHKRMAEPGALETHAKRCREWRLDNIEQARDNERKWRKANPDKVRATARRHYLKKKAAASD